MQKNRQVVKKLMEQVMIRGIKDLANDTATHLLEHGYKKLSHQKQKKNKS